MAVPIQVATGGQAVEAGAPSALFAAHIAEGPVPASNNKHQYAVTADGKRFLMKIIPEGTAAPPITVVVNWTRLSS